MKSNFRRIVLMSLVGVFALFLSFEGLSAEEKTEKLARSVDTAILNEGVFELPFSTTGYLEATQEVAVSPKIGGLIAEMKVDIGSRVKKGDVLFTFDDTYYKLDLESAEAAVATAKANLDDVLAGVRPEDIENARLAVENARFACMLAEADFKRTEMLYKSGNETEQTYIEEASRYNILKVAMAQAETNYQKAQNGATATQKDVLKRAVAQAQANAERVKQQLADTVVLAPFSGIVTERSVAAGVWLGTGDKGLTLLDDSKLRFLIGFPERYAMLVNPGLEVEIRFNGSFEKRKIDFVLPKVNPSNRTITAYINFDNPDGKYPTNMLGEISTTLRVNGFVVPSTALVYRGSNVLLCLVQDGKAKFVSVTPSVSSGSFVKISGIAAGSAYVTRSASDIFEGESVKAVETNMIATRR